MRTPMSLFLGLAALALAALPASAQLGARSVEVQPFVSTVSFDDDTFLDNAIGYGGRLGYNFTDNWALEGTFHFVPNVDPDFGDDFDDDFGDETTVWLAHANLNYNFNLNQSQLVPFLTAGGGFANFNVDNDDDIDEESATDGEVNAGGGLKFFLSETVAIRGDVRNHWIFTSIPNEDPGEPEDEEDAETTSNLELSAGVTFNF